MQRHRQPQFAVRMRAMTTQDIPQVHKLEQEIFPQDAWPLPIFLAEIQEPGRTYLVLEQQGSIIGYAGSMTLAETADIQTIAIHKQHRRYGYGTALLNRLEEEAGQAGAERVLLEVRADNPGAQKLYLRQGYRKIHQRRGYYGGGVDAIIMQKNLESSQAS